MIIIIDQFYIVLFWILKDALQRIHTTQSIKQVSKKKENTLREERGVEDGRGGFVRCYRWS